MVIRELLDRIDREKESHKAAVDRLEEMRNDILSCCRNETQKTLGGRKGFKCQGQEDLRAAA
jgi:hypothetical protein